MVNQPAKRLLEKHGILNIRIHSIKNALQYNAQCSVYTIKHFAPRVLYNLLNVPQHATNY